MMFNVYLTNLGKYNEGELIGEWMSLPISVEGFGRVLQRIGINKEYEEWFITDHDINISGLSRYLGEYTNLEEMNYLAGRLKEIGPNGQKKFEAVLESWSEEEKGIPELINLTYNLNCYTVLEHVKNDYDLGWYWVRESGIYELSKLGALVDYIDYEKLGRNISINDAGVYSDIGYVSCNGDVWDEKYAGNRKQIPKEYRVFDWEDKMKKPKEKEYER